jgi:hypothetical protein
MQFASIVKFRRTPPTPPRYELPPNRFWDETLRVPGLFERFRHADDLPNAVACFDRMARFRYQELINHPDFDRTKTSVISVFQPKSGGTYLQNRMLELGYHDFWWCFSDRICPSHCYAGFDALELFMSGGCTCHTHARPEANILAALDRAGVEKIWVHLRNPAESAVSAYYHYLGEGHGEGSIGEQRKNEALAEAAREGIVPGMEVSEFVVDAIPFFVSWVAEWLRFASQHPGLIVFSYFSELSDPQALFSRVFHDLGIDLRSTVTVEPKQQDRFRTKRSTNWQFELSKDAGRQLEQRIRAELDDFPQFARLWT